MPSWRGSPGRSGAICRTSSTQRTVRRARTSASAGWKLKLSPSQVCLAGAPQSLTTLGEASSPFSLGSGGFHYHVLIEAGEARPGGVCDVESFGGDLLT